MVRKCLLQAALILGLLVATSHAQQAPSSTQFKSGIAYVQVDVSVLDPNRLPVRGLSAADFIVREDGRPQKVLSFSEVELPAAEKPAVRWMRDVAPDVRSNNALASGRLVLIVLDDGQIRPQKSMEARVKAIGHRIVDQMGPADLAAVVFTKINSGAQNFTNDRTRLLAAIDGFAGHYSAANEPVTFTDSSDSITTESDRLTDYFNKTSLTALENVVKNLSLAPERRKAIAYVSVGMNISVNPTKDATNADGSTPTNFEDRGGLRAQMLDIFRQAQRANVNVYSIDPSGLGGVVDEGVAALADIGSVSNTGLDLKQEFLRTLAENTGGLAIVNMQDFASGLDQMFGENASYYLLGYESPNVRPDGKFHKIDVNVSRPGVTVRARRGFFDPRDTKAARNDGVSSDLAGAVTGLLPINGVELRVAAAPFWQPGRSEAAVTIALGVRPVIPPGARLVDDVQLIASALDGSGSEEASVRESFHIEGTGGEYERLLLLKLKPGQYELRVAAQSKAQLKAGSVFTNIDVPDFSKAVLSLSGILLQAQPGLSIAPADRLAAVVPVTPTTLRDFSRSQKVTAFLRVYQGGKDPVVPVSLRAQILDSQNRIVYDASQTLDRQRFAADRTAETRLDLPVGQLPPGAYLLSLQGTEGNGAAQREVRFQVIP